MKINLIRWIYLFALITASAISTPYLFGQDGKSNAEAAFQQAVADYQKSPSYDSVSKVIQLAAALDKKPTVPEEARKHFVRGTILFKEATTKDDYSQAINEFNQAILLAPWLPEARYNRAMVLEADGIYDAAVMDFKKYLLFKLSDEEARTVQDKIYALELKAEKANAQKAEQNQIVAAADAAKEQAEAAKHQRPGLGGKHCSVAQR